MNPYYLKNLQESYLNVYNNEFLDENVSSGRGRAAAFNARRGGETQRISRKEAEALMAAAQRVPEPIAEPKQRQKRKGSGLLPSRGIEPGEKVLRGYGRTPEGIAKRRATDLLKRSRSTDLPISDTLQLIKRSDKIKAALKKAKKWGTPEAAAEEVILGYLIDEGYADCLGSAEIILENMGDDWMHAILEHYYVS